MPKKTVEYDVTLVLYQPGERALEIYGDITHKEQFLIVFKSVFGDEYRIESTEEDKLSLDSYLEDRVPAGVEIRTLYSEKSRGNLLILADDLYLVVLD